MAYLNKDKVLKEGNIYHAYNRGYRKQRVFHDTQDYDYFIHLIRKYLDPDMRIRKRVDQNTLISVYPSKLCYEVTLLAYCLMPNHYHLLLKLNSRLGMSRLMSRIGSSYSKHYNYKYEKVGGVWQGTYRAVRVRSKKQLKDTVTYIHQNPIDITVNAEKYKYSSIRIYSGEEEKVSWIDVVR